VRMGFKVNHGAMQLKAMRVLPIFFLPILILPYHYKLKIRLGNG
jgi:hypothetical protein